MSSIICFGEVLWDKFPNYKKIGGAPLNVALRLSSFHLPVQFVSRIGRDTDGELIFKHLTKEGLSTEFIQYSENLRTGEVMVHLDADGVASYTIEEPRAWDEIECNEALMEAVGESKAFVFGSLIARNPVSRNTLFQLLPKAGFKVFDVNLRPPFYNLDTLTHCMAQADLIKFNEEELEQIVNDLQDQALSLEDSMLFVAEKFNNPVVCTTRGDKGAVLLKEGVFYKNRGYVVKVKDTVGAGDSFLASLLSQLMAKNKPQQALDISCAVGAFVASQEGANPKISGADISGIMQ